MKVVRFDAVDVERLRDVSAEIFQVHPGLLRIAIAVGRGIDVSAKRPSGDGESVACGGGKIDVGVFSAPAPARARELVRVPPTARPAALAPSAFAKCRREIVSLTSPPRSKRTDGTPIAKVTAVHFSNWSGNVSARRATS